MFPKCVSTFVKRWKKRVIKTNALENLVKSRKIRKKQFASCEKDGTCGTLRSVFGRAIKFDGRSAEMTCRRVLSELIWHSFHFHTRAVCECVKNSGALWCAERPLRDAPLLRGSHVIQRVDFLKQRHSQFAVGLRNFSGLLLEGVPKNWPAPRITLIRHS